MAASPIPRDPPPPEVPATELPPHRRPEWLRDTPYWLIASLVHIALLLVFASIVVFEKAPEKERVQTIVRMENEKPPFEPKEKFDLEEIPREVTENPPSRDLSARVAKEPVSRRKAEVPQAETPIGVGEGDPDFGADVVGEFETGGRIPSGANASVLAALQWLKRHQHPDGHWSASGFHERCTHADGPCTFEHPDRAIHPTDGGDAAFDIGVTALALLAFSGFGITHRDGTDRELRDCVRRGTRWLIAQQVRSEDPALDGLIGAPIEGTDAWVYNHAIATLALSDILIYSDDRVLLRRTVEGALEWCLRAQTPNAGWRYGYADGASDTSVTGWMVFALKSAKACLVMKHIRADELALDAAFAGALRWIENTTGARSAITGYRAPGDPGSQLRGVYEGEYPYSKQLSCMTAVAVLSRIFAGEGRRNGHQKLAIAHLLENLPEWTPPGGRRASTINFYSWYYASYALYQVGGARWEKWYAAIVPTMTCHQRTKGCAHGSWDPIGEWGVVGGRVYSTAMGALILEVTYRYAREMNTAH